VNPASVAADGPAFTLTVNGSGFTSDSIVRWDEAKLSTRFIGASQLTALVAASRIDSPGTVRITVSSGSAPASNAVMFTITAPLSIVSPGSLPAATVGVPYSQALTATGGTLPYGWSIAAGSLPPGVNLSTVGPTQAGIVAGTPTAGGNYDFTVRVTDGAGASATRRMALSVGSAMAPLTVNSVVHAASYAAGGIAPGEMVTVFGSGLGPQILAGIQLDRRGYVATSVAGTQVLFDGVAAPVIYAQAGQVSVIVPYAVAGRNTVEMKVTAQGLSSAPMTLQVVPAAPGIFTMDSSGRGQVIALNQDGTLNSAANRAAAGSYVSIFLTGEGQTNPAGVDGKPSPSPAPVPVLPVSASVGGFPAQVQYAGGVPGLVAGFLQVNVRVPQGVPPGPVVPITVNVGDRASQANAVIAVR
jgi:uncharacterized protein (TIGR03437 family)